MISKFKIKISDKELEDPSAKVDLIKLTGPNTYKKALAQFANQRLPKENPGGFSDEDLEKLSQEEYEKVREKITKDLVTADPEKPVFAEIEIAETQLNTIQAKELFLKRFGYNRFMQAQGLQGLEELGNQAYHQVLDREYKPYRTSWEVGRSNVVGNLGE